MKFGHFDDENREYVITRPDTPYPWINYLGNDDFFSLISNTAGGYSFYKDARGSKRGNDEIGSNFNDDPLWLILSVTEYIKETGDFAILDELVPFDNDESKSASLFEHLK